MSIDPAQVSHGDLPLPRTDGHPFSAKYDVLIFVRMNEKGSYVARIHHFNATGSDFASMKKAMEVAIDELRKPGNIDVIPTGSLNSPTLIRSFKNMAFSAQSNVLIYFDNSDYGFHELPLFFTKQLHDGTNAKKNKAFYDAQPVQITLSDGAANAAYVRNYFTKGSDPGPGKDPITKPEKFTYAFNFYMTATDEDDPARKARWIFDPDGGNMGTGGPPP